MEELVLNQLDIINKERGTYRENKMLKNMIYLKVSRKMRFDEIVNRSLEKRRFK